MKGSGRALSVPGTPREGPVHLPSKPSPGQEINAKPDSPIPRGPSPESPEPVYRRQDALFGAGHGSERRAQV